MQKFNNKYRIDTARAKWWNYSNDGKYFITICTKNRTHLFGFVKNNEMILNDYGKIVEKCWFDLPNHYSNVVLDAFQIMPNHIHCIISVLNDSVSIPHVSNSHESNDSVSISQIETGLKPVCTAINNPIDNPINNPINNPIDNSINNPEIEEKELKTHGVFEFIRALKTFSSRRINELRNSKGVSNWQERFHDHIIRNDEEYHRIKNYIINNPKKWSEDCHFTK